MLRVKINLILLRLVMVWQYHKMKMSRKTTYNNK